MSFLSYASSAAALNNLSNTGVPLTVHVSAIITGLVANVTGTSVPGASLQLFVNNVSQRLLTVPADGNYTFSQVTFVEGNNTLRILASNNGLHTNFSTFIQADGTPPILAIAPISAVSNAQNILLNGSVNEPSTILIKIRNLVGDGKPPKSPGNLQAAEITGNAVQINWTPINQSDNPTYLIYRNGVAIASTRQRMFDDVSLNTQTSYAYFVTARDGECLESPPSNSITIVTHAGGQQITNLSTQGPDACVESSEMNGRGKEATYTRVLRIPFGSKKKVIAQVAEMTQQEIRNARISEIDEIDIFPYEDNIVFKRKKE